MTVLPEAPDALVRDLTDEEARAALVCKWGLVAPDVLPAWVAEMDYALAEPIVGALQRAVAQGRTGYPAFVEGGPLGEAYAGFAQRRFGHAVDPERVIATVDVTAGVRLALDVVVPPGPLVLPVPAYRPQLALAGICGRERRDLLVDPAAERAELDLDALEAHFAAGARVLLLTQPHNPWGRVFTRAELEAVRDVVTRHGGWVVSDEIHAPLTLDGRPHVPYLSLEGTAEHAVAVVAASKAFNVAGLRCAQLVAADAGIAERLVRTEMARNDSWSVLGVEASIAAYAEGDAWLDALRHRLAAMRDLFVAELARELPQARMRPLEATYLAWVDLRAYGHDDPAARALDVGRLRVNAGHDFHPGLAGHVRVNLATSAERVREIVRRLALALR
ncbi:aminotransferase class I/II-fold pyridoxal phosphate-dependent enzyme [Nocardioides sp. TRM66260-LWL]|uniref:MalY/PatB family protein n=1 Tax=Nocardioides sp. TRM66260-LWL TaxID=2874478 RepID=UPI001CC4017E|nr:aminotransferase class I/II-fold pyridoxal phosphate-dependent enzyme [Nocardioides sp. TRM66260-LWL]MBZ5733838.1 aminotransferase class I/II-fold pyridoxal phosphate-dependent enzyme [Nocardioides sp. TRM66260-LWL]